MAAAKSEDAKKEKKTAEQEFHLEEAFGQLEDIIKKLESEQVSLKESIELYGQGAKLVSRCKEELTGIEKEMILIDENFHMEEE